MGDAAGQADVFVEVEMVRVTLEIFVDELSWREDWCVLFPREISESTAIFRYVGGHIVPCVTLLDVPDSSNILTLLQYKNRVSNLFSLLCILGASEAGRPSTNNNERVYFASFRIGVRFL